MKESYYDKIIAAQTEPQGSLQDRLQKAIKSIPQSAAEYVSKHVARPAVMLFTELIVACTCLYAYVTCICCCCLADCSRRGFNFGLIYCLLIYSPEVFEDVYGFGYIDLGLSFIGLIVGCILGPVLLVLDIRVLQVKGWAYGFEWLLPRRSSSGEELPIEKAEALDPQPERRLRGALIGGLIIPVGLIWFAWTAMRGISWISPILAQVLISCGALMVYVSTSAYVSGGCNSKSKAPRLTTDKVVDVYGPKYGASANAASSISRYLLAGAVPLFILPMYKALGVGWTTSILALVALLLAPIPFFFFRFGSELRSRCKFQRTV